MGKKRPRTVVFDTGALIALERGDGRVRALIETALGSGGTIVLCAPVLAQCWRNGASHVRLARFIRMHGVEIEPMDTEAAKACGAVCATSKTADIVNAFVALQARIHSAVVVTSDPDDLRAIDASIVLHQV
jgi:predicted nucleic acid-binding protein